MTMHAAKGLEFPVVFVVGVNQDVVPHIMAAEEGRLDEERRLFYVAMTRAKDSLHISFPEMVRKWNKMIEMSPSPFLRDMLTATEEEPAKPHIVRKS
jgi:superfamily I DNA/RNA helicase